MANMVINLVFIPVQSERRRFADRTAKVTTLLLLQIIRPYRTGDRSCYFIMIGTITSLKHPRVWPHLLRGPADSGGQRTRAIGR